MDILSNVIVWIVDSCQTVLGWLIQFWHACGNVILVFLTFFIIFSVVRVLLVPLIGHAVSAGQSDRVRSTTTYKPFKTSDGSTWYSANTSYTKKGE